MTIREHRYNATERVRFVHSDDKLKPWGIQHVPTMTLRSVYTDPDGPVEVHPLDDVNYAYIMELGMTGNEIADTVAAFHHRHGIKWKEVTVRFFRIFHQTDVEVATQSGMIALHFRTESWKRDAGEGDGTTTDIWAWIHGEVYGVVHEQFIPACEKGHPAQWVEQDSVWGYYHRPQDQNELAQMGRDNFPIGSRP